jgi:Ca2+-binding RTX toxin-like protein
VHPRPRHLVLPAVASLVTAVLAASGSPSVAADAPTCDGQAATIVGDGSRATITGTEGPDVIVSNGAGRVDARGGDDTVCVTGNVSEVDFDVKVFDGTGDDVVIDQATLVPDAPGVIGAPLTVSLVEGGDRFVGNDVGELVLARSGADTIETGGGGDTVVVGSQESGAPGRPDFTGRVDVGGAGSVTVGPDTGPAATFVTDGSAPAGISLGYDVPTTGSWSIDVPAGTVSLDGDLAFRVEGFRSYSWFLWRVDSFVGTSGDDVVNAAHLGDAVLGDGADRVVAPHVDGPVDAGAGPDLVQVGRPDPGTAPLLTGGDGQDSLQLSGTGGVTLDEGTGVVAYDDQPETHQLAGFEDLLVRADRLTYDGTSGPDRLLVDACRVVVRTGDGDDHVSATTRIGPDYEDGRCRTRATLDVDLGDGADRLDAAPFQRSTVRGGPGPDVVDAGGTVDAGTGDDVVRGRSGPDVFAGGPGSDRLRGGQGDDRLHGGFGRDLAFGGRGRDRCSAEVRLTCERGTSG